MSFLHLQLLLVARGAAPPCDGAALLAWARRSSGVEIGHVVIRARASGERGVYVDGHAVADATPLITISASSPIVIRALASSRVATAFAPRMRMAAHASATSAAATYSLAWTLAKRRRRAGAHAHYFACLPQKCALLWCAWSREELAALGDADAARRARADAAAVTAAYNHMALTADLAQAPPPSRRDWRWAVSVVVSRAFRDPSQNAAAALALVPVLDAVNHDPTGRAITLTKATRLPAAGTAADTAAGGTGVAWTIVAHEALAVGDEVVWAYSAASGLFAMLSAYGFIPTDARRTSCLRVRIEWRNAALAAHDAAAVLQAACARECDAQYVAGAVAVDVRVAAPIATRAAATLRLFRAMAALDAREACAPRCSASRLATEAATVPPARAAVASTLGKGLARCIARVVATPLHGACEARALHAMRSTVARLATTQRAAVTTAEWDSAPVCLVDGDATCARAAENGWRDVDDAEAEEAEEEAEEDAREARWMLARAYRDARGAIIRDTLRDIDLALEHAWSDAVASSVAQRSNRTTSRRPTVRRSE